MSDLSDQLRHCQQKTEAAQEFVGKPSVLYACALAAVVEHHEQINLWKHGSQTRV